MIEIVNFSRISISFLNCFLNKFESRSGDTTLCDTVCQWLATGRSVSTGTPVSSTNKTDHHDITEILLKVTLNTINLQTIISLLSVVRLVLHVCTDCINEDFRSGTTCTQHTGPRGRLHLIPTLITFCGESWCQINLVLSYHVSSLHSTCVVFFNNLSANFALFHLTGINLCPI